tara:strand:+ start:210 stop:650 length:441 start_codon:yes stop_codon:yes gene_type:complete
MKSIFKVSSVKEVVGFVNGSDCYPNKYGNSYTTLKNHPKSLLIRGEIDGVDTSFFSPTVIVRESIGILNNKHMDENSWFEQIEGETQSARGAEMFDGGKSPNIALFMPSEILPKIKVGDEINISYQPKGEFNGTKTIKSVKVVKNN